MVRGNFMATYTYLPNMYKKEKTENMVDKGLEMRLTFVFEVVKKESGKNL